MRKIKFYIALFFSFSVKILFAQIPGPVYNPGGGTLLRSGICNSSPLVTSMPTGGKMYATLNSGTCNGFSWIKVDVVGDHAGAPISLFCPYAPTYMQSTTANYVTVTGAPNGLLIHQSSPAGSLLWVGYNYASLENNQKFITTGATQQYNGNTWYEIYVPNNVKTASNGISQTTAWVSGAYLIYSNPGCPLPAAPVIASPSQQTQNSFTANWNSVPGITYYLDVSTNPSFSSFVSVYNNLNVGNAANRSVTGLSNNTTYYYRVRAGNACGTSGNSGSQSCTTGTPCVSPSAFTLNTPTGVTSSSVNLSWTVSPNAESYDVCYAANNCPVSTAASLTTSATSATINGLTGGVLYKFIVVAKNAGCSTNSNCQSATTLNGCAPIVFTSQPVNETAALQTTVNFTVSVSGSAPVYQWQVSTNGGSTWANVLASAPYSGTTTAALSINPVSAGLNNNKYRCLVSNNCTTPISSGIAILTVGTMTTPTITINNSLNQIPTWQRAGDDLVGSITASYSNMPIGGVIQLDIYQDGIRFRQGADQFTTNSSSGTHQFNFTISQPGTLEGSQIGYQLVHTPSHVHDEASVHTPIIEKKWDHKNIVYYNAIGKSLKIPLNYNSNIDHIEVSFYRPDNSENPCGLGSLHCDQKYNYLINHNDYPQGVVPQFKTIQNENLKYLVIGHNDLAFNLSTVEPGDFVYSIKYFNINGTQIGQDESNYFDLTKIGKIGSYASNDTLLVLIGGNANTIEDNIAYMNTHPNQNGNPNYDFSIAENFRFGIPSTVNANYNTWYVATGNTNFIDKNAYDDGIGIEQILIECQLNNILINNITLCSHSFGGLAVRTMLCGLAKKYNGGSYSQPYSFTNKLKSVILLATPNKGVSLLAGNFVVGNAKDQVRFGSGFINTLNSSIIQTSGVRFLNITGNDLLLSDPSSNNPYDGVVSVNSSENPILNDLNGAFIPKQLYVSQNVGGITGLHTSIHHTNILSNSYSSCENSYSILNRIFAFIRNQSILSCPFLFSTQAQALMCGSVLSGGIISLKRSNELTYHSLGFSDFDGRINFEVSPAFESGDSLKFGASGYQTLFLPVDSLSTSFRIAMIKNLTPTQSIQYSSLKLSTQNPITSQSTIDLTISATNATSYQINSPNNQDTAFMPITLSNGHYSASLDTGYNRILIKFIGAVDTVIVAKEVYYFPGTLMTDNANNLPISTTSQFLGAKLYIDNQFAQDITTTTTVTKVLKGSREAKFSLFGYRDTVFTIGSTGIINLSMQPMIYTSETDSAIVDFDAHGDLQYWKNITLKRTNAAAGTKVVLKQCADTLPPLGLIPLSRCFDFINYSPAGYPVIKTAICVDQAVKMSKKTAYLLLTKNDTVYTKILFDSSGVTDFDSTVQKLTFNPIDFDSGRVTTQELRIMKRLPPIVINHSYTLGQNDSITISLHSLFADPDSLKNDMAYALGNIGPGLTVSMIGDSISIKVAQCANNTAFSITAIHDGLTVINTININITDGIVATANSSTNSVCVGTTLQLSSTGGVSYSWTGPAGFTSTQQDPAINNFTASNAGTYTVTVTGSNGCTANASTLVVLNIASPLSDIWIQKANFGGVVREGVSGLSIGGKGYIGLGYNGTQYYSDFWEYDPATNTWTQKANFPGSGRANAACFSIGNKGYIATGWNGSNDLKDLWEYDPANNVWTQKSDFAGVARELAVGFSIGNYGYIGTGGYGNSSLNDFWEYNPASDTWTQKANCGGVARHAATGFSIGTKGYIGTGYNGNNLLNDFWEYDQTSNSWFEKANFGGSPRILANGFSIGTKGYIGAGSSNTLVDDFWEYNPNSNTWSQKANFAGSSRSESIGFSIGNKGYLGMGHNGSNLLNDFWEYTPSEISSLQNNLISYWKFDGNSNDAYGTNNGSDVSIAYSSGNGKINQGAGFDGSSSKIAINGLTIPSDATYSCWFKTTQVPNSINPAFMGFSNGAGLNGGQTQRIGIMSPGRVTIFIRDSNGDTASASSTTLYNDGNWHFVTGVKKGNNAYLYVDGVLVASDTATLTGSFGDTPTFYFGTFSGISEFYSGAIDEAGFWNRALSAVEILNLYNQGSGIQHPFNSATPSLQTNLISYYKLDGNSNDATGSNNGTDAAITYSSGSGKINEGAGFNGATSGIINSTVFSLPTNATISCWFKTTQTPSGANPLIFGYRSGNSFPQFIIVLSNNTGHVDLYCTDNGLVNQQINSVNALNDGNWHFVTGTKAGGTLSLYVDGLLIGSSNTTYTGDFDNVTMAIGHNPFNTEFYAGSIDECGFWGRALSAGEILDLYNNSHGVQYPFLAKVNPVNTPTSLCAGAGLTIPYTVFGSFECGNIFTAQLSDASGSFASPTNIGTVTLTTSGTINATIPSNTSTGNGYRIRIVSSSPALKGADNGSNISIHALPVATANSNPVVCAGDTIKLFSSGGTRYSWTGPNGFTSSEQNPVIVHATAANSGVYTVTVSNSQDTWLKKADFGGVPCISAVSFGIGNKAYIGTGKLNTGQVTNDFWEWDRSSNIWTQKAGFGGPPPSYVSSWFHHWQ